MNEERLGSWTRTLNESEAMLLLDLAEPGTSLDEWAERGHDELPQAARARRQGLIRLAQRYLLDHDDQRVLDSTYLRLFREGSARRRRDLLHGRHYLQRPWAQLAAREVIAPALVAADAPLAPLGAGQILKDDWDDFIDRHLAEGTGPQARTKTRTVLIGAMEDLGVVERFEPRSNDVRVQHARPDGLAFGCLVALELALSGRSEAQDDLLVSRSDVALLFCLRPETARDDLERAIDAGLLERSYLAGIARVRLPAREAA